MLKRKRIVKVTSVLLLHFALVTASSFAEVAFQGLGSMPSGYFNGGVTDISADGLVVVGYTGYDDMDTGNLDEAFRWTAETGMQSLGWWEGSWASSASSDGSVIAGSVLNVADEGYNTTEAVRWTADAGIQHLGKLPAAFFMQASGISADGSIVVGSGEYAFPEYEAFRWTEETGMVGLGDLPGDDFESHASDISADGLVIIGSSRSSLGTEAFRWTAKDGMVGLGLIPGGFNSYATALSTDGSVIVGSGYTGDDQAFRWTEEEGMVLLGVLSEELDSSSAYDVSADGSVIVGSASSGADDAAFIWDEINGMQSIQELLGNSGLDLTGWTLESAVGVSVDGLTIIGNGYNPDGNQEAWVATIPEPATLLLFGLGGLVLRRRSGGV